MMKNFLNKHKTVIITVVIILALLMLFYVFKDDIKALFSKNETLQDVAEPNNTNNTSNNTNNTTISPIGKSAYAKQNSVAVLYKVDASTSKTKNKDEFVGVINGTTTLGGAEFYTLGTGSLVVAKNKVYIK